MEYVADVGKVGRAVARNKLRRMRRRIRLVCVRTFSGISRNCSCAGSCGDGISAVSATATLTAFHARRERTEYRQRCNYEMIFGPRSLYRIPSPSLSISLSLSNSRAINAFLSRLDRGGKSVRAPPAFAPLTARKVAKLARKKIAKWMNVTHSRRRGPGSPSLRKLQKLAMARGRKYLVIIVGGSTTGHYTCIHVHRGQRWRDRRTGRSTFPFIGVDIKCNSS